MKQVLHIAVGLFSLIFISCNSGPKPIVPGKYNCDYCRMTVTDLRYASELLTRKGRVYIFDDIHCMLKFVEEKSVPKNEVKEFYVCDFNGEHSLMNASKSFFLHSEDLRSPMGGNIAAFSSSDSMKALMQQFHGEPVYFNNLLK